MLQQNDLHVRDAATHNHTQEQREQAALAGNALRLQELFVALWEAKRHGQSFAGSLYPDHPNRQQTG